MPSFAGIESGGSVVKRDSAGVIGGNVEAQVSAFVIFCYVMIATMHLLLPWWMLT